MFSLFLLRWKSLFFRLDVCVDVVGAFCFVFGVDVARGFCFVFGVDVVGDFRFEFSVDVGSISGFVPASFNFRAAKTFRGDLHAIGCLRAGLDLLTFPVDV